MPFRARRVRFAEAVPSRRDRRDLRRRFRRVARHATAERKTQTVALLQRLSADRVPLLAVLPGQRNSERVIEFGDGTRLLIAARYGTGGIKRLRPGAAWSPVWLAQVQPAFTRRSFRLWFASAGRPGLVEMMATVAAPAPPPR